MKKITIYTNENCPYCKTIKEKLNSEGIKFEERLTSKYEKEWQKVSDLTGMPQVPTIVLKNKYLIPARDFYNEEHLINLLNITDEVEVDYNAMNFERIKTLNYNIFNAFNRLEGVLRQIEGTLNKEEGPIDEETEKE